MLRISSRAGRKIAWSFAAIGSLLSMPRVDAQEDRVPRLPGAVSEAPAWLKDAPFDVAKFFAMPRSEENAAPLYLDAFHELDSRIASCFPPTLPGRSEAIKTRWLESSPLLDAWLKNPSTADPKEMDVVLARFADFFHKLELAQERPRCVFATAVMHMSPVPHANASRNAGWLLGMRADRDLDGGDIDHAIGCVERMLRLARDIRPRGNLTVQIASGATEKLCVTRIVPRLLSHDTLKGSHYERLIAVLQAHDRMSLDPYRTAIQADYIERLAGLRLFSDRVRVGIDPEGRAVNEKLDREAFIGYLMRSRQYTLELMDELRIRRGSPALDETSVGTLIDRLSADAPRARQAFDDIARSLLAIPVPSYPARLAASKKLAAKYNPFGMNSLPLLARGFYDSYDHWTLQSARDLVTIRASLCLLAIRRWQLTRPGAPTDLDAICKAAGMPGVPADPFAESPLKMTSDADGIVIYSVGPDGRDDRGLKNSGMYTQPGDILVRMPRVTPRDR